MAHKPWTSAATVTVVYSDGFSKTVAAFPTEDGLDEACAEDNLGDIMDSAARAQFEIYNRRNRTHNGLGRGEHYPMAVVVMLLEGSCWGGRKLQSGDWLADTYESEQKSEAHIFRVYDVAGYLMMEELQQLLCVMAEEKPNPIRDAVEGLMLER
jgi:hypothetical protein